MPVNISSVSIFRALNAGNNTKSSYWLTNMPDDTSPPTSLTSQYKAASEHWQRQWAALERERDELRNERDKLDYRLERALSLLTESEKDYVYETTLA